MKLESRKKDIEYDGFSILIPSWNNLKYLQLCLKSIATHSSYQHQIIVIINEGIDGTKDWIINDTNYDFIFSSENIGICHGLNHAAALANTDYIMYSNDDMYFLPKWDVPLMQDVSNFNNSPFMLSATMIEPRKTSNTCVVVGSFGEDIDTFEEALLLRSFDSLYRKDWNGSTWPPNIVHRKFWDMVGGMSIEFSPGMYSDPDLAMKLYQAGIRIFKGNGKSLVYHFGSKSTKRLRENTGRKIFLKKWKISAKSFYQYYLKMGSEFSPLPQNYQPNWLIKMFNHIKVWIN